MKVTPQFYLYIRDPKVTNISDLHMYTHTDDTVMRLCIP